VPLKTLEDYFCILKKASLLGFDFKGNSREKIGHIRRFVNSNKTTLPHSATSSGSKKTASPEELKFLKLVDEDGTEEVFDTNNQPVDLKEINHTQKRAEKRARANSNASSAGMDRKSKKINK